MTSYNQLAALAMLSFGVPAGYSGSIKAQHWPNPDAQYTDSGKPMSKRRKRRLRGKAKP